MTAVLLAAMLITGPVVDNTWAVADAGSLINGFIPVDASTPPAKRIDRDRIATEQQTQKADDVAYGVWDRLAECESGGNWQSNTGTFDGGLQFLPSTWNAMGGREFAPYAWQATREEQIIVAERTLRAGGWSQWPACSRKLGLR